MSVGEKMRIRRKELGMTGAEVAKLIGVSTSTLYRYESGDIDKVDSEKLMPIATALQTTPGYLMGWEDDKNEPAPARPDVRKVWVKLSEGERVLTDEQLNLLYNVAHQMRPDVYPPLDELKG